MKKLVLILTILFCINIQTIEAQTINIDSSTIIKNIDGKKVSVEKFAELMNSGNWMMDEKTDAKGNKYIQLRKSTEEEKEMFNEMMKEHLDKSDIAGKEASPFSLTDIDGNKITSENTKGKVFVVNFWFIACKPCVKEIPELNKVYEKYKNNKNVVFASITFDKKEKVEMFLKKHPISYPIVTNDKETIAVFGINGYPTNLIIGKDGNIAKSITGGFPQIGEHIDDAIDKALKAK